MSVDQGGGVTDVKADGESAPRRFQGGDDDEGHTHEGNCLNCGTPLAGPHCHVCGQKAHVHRTIAAWWHDFLHSVIHLDGGFWRTLPMLAWRPGELTRRYVAGERTKFISPLGLFLFTVFLMLAAFSAWGGQVHSAEEVAAELPAELEASRRSLARLEEDRRIAAAAGGGDMTERDLRIADLRQEIAAEERLLRTVQRVETPSIDVRTGWALFDEGLKKASENSTLLFYKMQANAYKFSWALIPISVPFVWLLFLHRHRYRREFTGYDHLVFVTYSIAFMSLVLVAFVLLGAAGLRPEPVNLAFLVIPPLHLYRQLRGAYRLSRGSAFWRTFALLIFAMAALAIFTLLLLLIGVIG